MRIDLPSLLASFSASVLLLVKCYAFPKENVNALHCMLTVTSLASRARSFLIGHERWVREPRSGRRNVR
jgi:hypothetical protein